MKTLSIFAGMLVLATPLPGQAQTPASATTHDNPTPAWPAPKPTGHRATHSRRAKPTLDSQTIGRKFVEKSKPDVMPMVPRLK